MGGLPPVTGHRRSSAPGVVWIQGDTERSVVSPPAAHNMQVTNAAVCQGGCIRLRGYLATATNMAIIRMSTMRYL